MIKKSVLLSALAIAGFAVTSLAQTVPNYVPSNGLVGWWPFNGNAIDESVNTNDGTVNGATLTADRFGSVNSAYSFNGINQKVVIADHNTLSFTNSIYSFSYWAKINSNIITSGAAIYCKYGITSNFEYANVLYSSNSLNFGSGNLAGTCGAQGGSANTTTLYNNWHHFVFVADGLNGSKTFVDGTLVNTGVYTACSGGNGNGNLYFGMGGGWNQQFYYNGLIDDIGIWNRALTPSEITGLYNGNLCFQTITVTDTLLINTNLTGFNPVTYQNTIKIWPNPTNDHITIDNGNLANLTGHQIKISNALGQQVFQSAITQQQFYVNMSTWGGNGIYFVNLINAQGVTIETRKIVLQ